jgi:NDP-hexose-3-ketoreductase
VLCEKPLATTRENATELTELAARRGLALRENFSFEHHSQHTKVRQLLAEGRFGTPRTFTASFCIPPLPPDDTRYNAALDGGALLDIGVYPLRAAQLFLGPDLTVAGATLRIDERLSVDLAGQVLLVSADGVFATLEFGIQHSYGSRYSLWGSSASIALDRAAAVGPVPQLPRSLRGGGNRAGGGQRRRASVARRGRDDRRPHRRDPQEGSVRRCA